MSNGSCEGGEDVETGKLVEGSTLSYGRSRIVTLGDGDEARTEDVILVSVGKNAISNVFG